MSDNPRIVLGTVPQLPDPVPAKTTLNADPKDGEAQAPHTVFQMVTLDYRCEGNIQVPVMGGTDGEDEAEIVQLSSPWGVREVIWVVARDGGLPLLPDPCSNDKNEVLADVQIGTVEPKVIDGVRYSFSVSGKYKYWLRKPSSKKTGFQMGASVISTVPAEMNVVTEKQFTKKMRGK